MLLRKLDDGLPGRRRLELLPPGRPVLYPMLEPVSTLHLLLGLTSLPSSFLSRLLEKLLFTFLSHTLRACPPPVHCVDAEL